MNDKQFLEHKQKLHEIICKHDNIDVFHHKMPDYDTQGACVGMFYWLKQNYPQKKVTLVNKQNFIVNSDFCNINDDKSADDSKLALIFDVNGKQRIDGWSENYDTSVVIDHHKDVVNDKFDLKIIYPNLSSTCELIYYLLKDKRFKFNKLVAQSLAYGLVTDTNRFLYDSVDEKTFEMAADLIKVGINFQHIYNKLYLKPLIQHQYRACIFNKFKTAQKCAYYISSKEIYVKYKIDFEFAKTFVHAMAGISEVEGWLLATQSDDKNFWAISLRSRSIPVNEFAEKYNGGGHRNAAGIKANDLKAVKAIIEDYKKHINNY